MAYRLSHGLSLSRLMSQVSQIQRHHIHTTCAALKKKKGNEKRQPVPQRNLILDDDNTIVKEASKQMQSMMDILSEELARHFSLKLDIRQYEQIPVKLENGQERQLSHLARVSLKSPLIVMINFQDNPSAIKAAKLAIQKSSLNVTPQQEGAVLYVNVPPMSRERREKMAADAKGKIMNDYKQALNEIYSKSDKESSKVYAQRPDIARNTRQALLTMKQNAELHGQKLIDAKREQLLKQVV